MINLAQSKGWKFVEPVAEDGSARRYDRVQKNGRSAILMNVYGDTPGHRLKDFVRIGAWLREADLSAPEIYEQGENTLIMEDFGGVSFKDALARGEDAFALYGLANDVLEHVAAQDCVLELPSYFDSHIHAARDLIMRWYVPAQRGAALPDGALEAYLSVWDSIQSQLPAPEMGVLHMDYHVENLMWLPERGGLKRCGILDFQGAMTGPRAYDLANLLGDMRADVPQDVQAQLLSGKSAEFKAWARVLGAQFHCRLIGQCIRWAARDDKPGYMNYLPRLFGYINDALKTPELAPLKAFFDEHKITFEQVPEFDGQALRALVRE